MRFKSNVGKIISALVWCALMLIFTSCVYDEEPEEWKIPTGAKCPEFSIVMNDGSTITTADLAGSTTMIVFFNTSCADCRDELPAVQAIYEEMSAGKNVEYSVDRIICISREEDASSVAEYWDQHDFTMPYSAQTDRAVYSLFATSGIPRYYVVDEQLKIKEVVVMY